MTEAQELLAKCLRDVAKRIRPAFIAEEASEEGMESYSVDSSIPEEIATESGLVHIFCDPTRAERDAMGYKEAGEILPELHRRNSWDMQQLTDDELLIRAHAIDVGCYFPVRERFWIERLGELSGHDGIFVCGDGHVKSFGRLLKETGIDSTESARRIGMSDQEVAWCDAVERYWNEHPELRDWCKPRTPASAL
jgi:hypothetical protein